MLRCVSAVTPKTAHLTDSAALTHVITRLRRALRRTIRSDYPWEALPMAQVEVMLCLRDHEHLRVGEIAGLLRLAPNTTSGLVQQLVVAKLAERSPDPADRRVAAVSLTDAGRELLADWTKAYESRIDRALRNMPEEQRAAVSAALPALARLAEELGAE
jgi:DNA-binding MarR family transcriptional regulator